ncbi:uncharacterized protein Dwil_GK18315 [Drosophila willistoni]|uniref:C2H2-type domain-containing protein n=1 Tax=Drosophila willistoni TaxID=7260 RepID=B4MZE3_DROWI|nr:zinc finger protein 250 [Drosophila willistoni]EDW77482.1 uncharacterized protein Dwil_GK18315 [Drosophila willistoni]
MGFKHAIMQRTYDLSPLSPPTPTTTATATTTALAIQPNGASVAVAAAAAPGQVTDFSISRILGKEKEIKKKTTSDILDLSKGSQPATQKPITAQPTTTSPIAVSTPASNPYLNAYSPDFLAMANATKFYAQFFPHLLPAYAAAAAAAGLNTPPTSPYQQTQTQHQQQQQQQHQQKRYFAPYVINGSSQTQSYAPRTKSSTACTRPDCLECLDYYKQLQSVAYKHSTPLISPAASSASSTHSTRPGRQDNLNLHLNHLTTSSTNISLTTVTNLSLSTSQNAASVALIPKPQAVVSAVGMGTNNTASSEEISYKCRICDKVFGCSETLQNHEKTHKSPRYECSDCGKGFSQLRNYKYHLSVHRGTKEFAAECPECGKTFNDKGYLSSHMKIHRNRKEYECPYCPKSFNQRVAFNMHVRIHTGVKPHKCTECGKRFSRKMLLKQHMRTHSGEKPYQCSVCGKSFADRSNMTLHHRLHSGIKPFSCPLCPKAFTKKHHLKTHLNYHTGCKPYVCPHPNCNQAFTQSSNMRTHAKKCQYRPMDSAPGGTYPMLGKSPSQGQSQVPASLSLATFAIPGPPPSATFPPAQQSLLSNLRTF